MQKIVKIPGNPKGQKSEKYDIKYKTSKNPKKVKNEKYIIKTKTKTKQIYKAESTWRECQVLTFVNVILRELEYILKMIVI